MKSKYFILIVIMIIFMFLITPFTSFAYTIDLSKNYIEEKSDYIPSSTDIIIIPDDYCTIQEGVNNAHQGDTIFVRSGIYVENIIINTEDLNFIGENKHTTIIDGSKQNSDGMDISAEGVVVKGFTISNAVNDKYSWDVSGIRINALDIEVSDNIFTSNSLGLCVMAFAYNSTILNNSFIDDGLMLGHYQRSNILKKQDFLHRIENNTVNNRPLYYIKDQNNFTAPYDAGQLILVNCSNVTIKDLYLSKTDFSVILAYCDNCSIENITVVDTDGEVILFNSDYNVIKNNVMINNLHGACLDYYCNYNIIKNNYASDNLIGLFAVTSCSYNIFENNTVERNSLSGIQIAAFCDPDQHDNKIINNIVKNNKYGINLALNSYNNLIEGNTVQGNNIGIRIKKSSNNTITNNTLKSNKIQALFLDCHDNIWQNNYWNRGRIFPKIILGYRSFGFLPIPWINIDKNPAGTIYK